MFQGLNFEPVSLPANADELRREVRAFLAEEDSWFPNSDFNAGSSAEFSQRLASKGWIGMTWPEQYGGRNRSFLE
ncbi:MAG: acyl-CoA dehydrogenase, partial [Candidatus Azotimanducaceae bacterium]